MAYRCGFKIRVQHKFNTNIFSRIVGLLSRVFSSSMHLILGWASCMDDCIGEVGAPLRSYGRPGCIISSGPFSWNHWSRSGGQSGTVTPRPSNLLLVPLAVWPGVKCWWKSKLAFFKACQQKEAQSAVKFPARWLCWMWTSEIQAPEPSATVKTSSLVLCPHSPGRTLVTLSVV